MSERAYKVDFVGGACPTQAWGRTADDRPFYFRSRHDHWQLHVGESEWPTDYIAWPAEPDENLIAEGVDNASGWLEDDEVYALLDTNLPGHP